MLTINSLTAQNTITVGTGTYSANYPFSTNYRDGKTQMLYTAAEITAAGGTNGIINSIAFDVTYLNTEVMNGFNIKIQQVSQTSLYSFIQTNWTSVYNNTISLNSTGWNTYNFTSPFTWDGTSSIVIEICYDNSSGSSSSSNVAASYISNKVRHYYSNSGSGCSFTSSYSRTSRPNIKFGLGSPSSNDFSTKEFTLPINGSTASATMPISIKVKNEGTAAQTGYSVKYSIDNGTSWTSKAVTSALASHASTNVTFTGSQTADMSSPGVYQCIGVVIRSGDTITNNDTIKKDIAICSGIMTGNYTVGNDTASNFPNINSAISAMKICGVSGPINLKVKPGTYNTQVRIGPITGITAASPLTIESLNGDPNSVIFEYTATNNLDNYVFKLDTCNYVNIKNITIKANGSGNYARSIDLFASNNCTIDGNIILNNTSTSSGVTRNNINVSSNAISTNNTFINNTIKNGDYGISIIGTSSYRNSNSLIKNNTFINNTNRSLSIQYANSIEINGNNISNNSNTSYNGIGIYIYNSIGIQKIIKNKLLIKSNSGMQLNYMSGTSSDPVLIANNFITQTNQANKTIYIESGSFFNFSFNSIHTKDGNTSYYSLDISNGSYNSFYNNNVINLTGRPLRVANTNSILSSDYNNYYTTSSYIAYYGGYQTSLAGLKSASGKEAHSINTNVSFYTDDNLHVSGSELSSKGIPVVGIVDDFDGQVRNTSTPDIGADEYDLYPNDAGITEFVNLVNGCPGSSQNISVKLSNYGTLAISNINIGWSVNGNLQTPYVWTGVLGLYSTTTSIGSYTFSGDTTYEIKAWINTVNLVTDSNAMNDTVVINNYKTSMPGGTYQIGSSSSADFSSISSAISAMNLNGICGPIVLNLENGVYSNAYDIPSITGASPTNTVTLQSLSGDTSDVKFVKNSSGTNGYIFQFSGSGYFNFKNLSFSSSSSAYSKIFNIINSARHISVDSCSFIGNGSTSTSSYNRLIEFTNSRQLSVTNSTLKNGSDAIYIVGASNSNANGIIIKNNNFTNFHNSAINGTYLGDTVIIHNNYIQGYNYGIYTYNSYKKVNITSNNIKITSVGNYGSGIYMRYHNASTSSSASSLEINNNFIDITTSTSTTAAVYGIYLYSSSYNNIYYNTIKIRNSNNVSSANLYLRYATNTNLKNNIFDAGNHYVMYTYATNYLNTSNYNSFYSTSTTPFYYSGNRTFAYYKSYSYKDANSKWGEPYYLANDDLHIHDFNLNNAGNSVTGITTDIDGETRGISGNPDIGADEFYILANDIQLYAINTPTNPSSVGSNQIKVAIRNMGTSNIILDSLHYSIDNGPVTNAYWTGNLTPLAIDSMILIGTETLAAGNHTIKAWSSYPNYTTDLNPSNDTLEKAFVIQAMPIITVNPTSISGTTTNCNDSLFIPLTIKNTGAAILNYSLDSNMGSVGPLQVLVLSYGSSYANTIISSMGQTFTNYQVTTSSANNVYALETAIVGKDVIVVPYTSNSSASIYSTFSTTLQNFVNDGGIVMFAGQYYQNTIINSGLWSNFYDYSSSNSTNYLVMPNHSITSNFTTSDLSSNSDYYYYFNNNITPANYTPLIDYSTSYKVAGYFPYGDGTVFYLGFRYTTANSILGSKLLSNSLEWAYDNRNGWISSSSTSGTVNPGDSTVLLIELNSLGLNNGTYISDLTISSNDFANPSVIVPCTLTVVGTPIIASNNSSVNFNAQYTNVAAFDSVQIYNNGCGDLTISGITTNNTAYSAISYDNTLTPGDTTWVVYKFLSTTSGAYAGQSTIASNGSNYTIYLTGFTTDPPAMTVTPTPLNITIPNCNDSVTTNLNIQNTGGGTLTANFNSTSDSAHIIILTYGSVSARKNNMISSFGYSFTKYDYTETNTLSSTVLQNLINTQNANVIVIPDLSSSSYGNSYSTLATTLQNFTNAGGTVIIGGGYYDEIFTATGLISGTRVNNANNISVTTQNTSDELTLNFPSSVSVNTEYIIYFNFTGTGITSLLKYNNYDVSVRKQYGTGQVIVLGFYYYNISSTPHYNQELLSNSIKSAATGVDWLGFSNTTANLSAGTTAVKPITFRSAGLTAGVHTTSIKINTNSPTTPIVYVPCTLTVQNQLANGVDLGNDTTSCGPLTLDAGAGFSSYLWNTGNTSQTITAVSSGTYSVTVGNGGPCSSSDTIVVVVVTNATASITGLPSNTCTTDGDISLTGLPAGGVFAGPGLTGNLFNPASAGVGTHTIFYTYNGTTCSSTASQPVTVSASPTVSFSGLAASYCPNDPSVGLFGTPTGGTFSGTGMITNVFYPSIAGLGSHEIVYSYTNAGGCTGFDTNTVVIGNTTINIDILLTDTGYCLSDAPVTLFANPAGGSYSGNGIIGNVFYPNIAGVGSHYIKYTVTSSTTCDAIDSIQVLVGAMPTGLAISGLPATFCYNAADVNINVTPSGGILSGYGITGNTFSPSIANIGTHVITYTVTNNGGCSASITQNTEVLAPPTITFNSMQSSYCENDDPFTVTVSPAGGSLNGNAITGNIFDPSLANTGSNYIYYTYSDANSCSNSDSFNVIINSSPSASILPITNSFCSTSPMEALSGTPAGGVFSGNGVIGTNFDPSLAGAGMHYVKYTYTDNNGCSAADSSTANVTAVHTVDAGSDASISYNSTSQLSGLISGGNGPFVFNWTPTSKVVNPTQLSSSTTNLTASTAFMLSVTDNSNACVNQDEVIITVTGGALAGTSTAMPTTICDGETSQLQTLGSGGVNSNYTYSWSSNPVGFTSSISNPTANPSVNTTYTCMVYDGSDSIASTVNVTVNESPNATITNLDTIYCSNDAMVQLTVTPPNGTLTGGGISGFNFIPSVAPLGNNTIIYSIMGSNGCYGADTVQLLVGATPSAYAGNDTILACTNGGLNLGQQPINGVSYLWSPATGLTDATIANPALSFNASMNYTLTATDDLSGCSNTDNIDIHVNGTPIASTNNDTLVCANSSVTLTATGGSSYFWSNGTIGNTITVSPIASTLYYVIVSDGGCSSLDTVWVNISDPKPYFGNDTTLCASQSITIDAGASNVSYDWSNGSTSQTVTIDSTGIGFGTTTIDVEVVNNLGCIGKDTIMITFVDCTGLNNIDDENFIMSIYPNPTKGLFTISSTETSIAKLKLEVLDLNGRIIYENQLLNTRGIISEQVDLSHRAKGIYIVRLSNGGMIKTFKVVVQ